MGRHSNLLLLDERDEILECVRHVTARVNRVRQSVPGEAYLPPPDFDKSVPAALTAQRLAELLPPEPRPLAEWLRSFMQGASDVFLAIVLHRQGLDATASTADLEATDLDWLLRTITGAIAEGEGAGPGYLCRPPGRPPLAYPLPPPPEWETLGTLDNLSAACQMLQRQVAQAGWSRQLRQRLTGVAEGAREKAVRRERERQASLDKARDAEQYRQLGQLLLAHLHEVPAGAEEVSLPGWEGETVVVRLDPRLSPQQNAQHYFDRYKKLQRVRERVPALLAEARSAREYFEDLLDQVESAEAEELRVLEAEMMEQGLIDR